MSGRSSSPPVENVTIYVRSKRDYCENFIYENDTLTTVLNSEGFFTVSGLRTSSFYYLRDHQGNVRAVTDRSVTVVQVNHYYPFGGLMGGSTDGELQAYKYGRKELDRMHGLDLYDFVARSQDPMMCRFLTMDPMCEKYYSVSPYAYCLNNPVNYVDPDGKDVFLFGIFTSSLRDQLSAGSRGLDLTLNEDGSLCYNISNIKRLNDYSLNLIRMIDNSSLTLNITTTDNNILSSGQYFVGGAFLGNEVTRDSEGNITVNAFQTINPEVLGASDDFTNTPGKMVMHELSEAYEGGLLSKERGVSSPPAGFKGSVYEEAHKRATPQTVIHQRWYDKYGRETLIGEDAFLQKFFVRNYLGKEGTIQIHNKNGKQ